MFPSTANSLVANDNATDGVDVFLHDRNTSTTLLGSTGTPSPAGSLGGAVAEISPDGTWIGWLLDLVAGTQTSEGRGFLTFRAAGETFTFVGNDQVHQGQDHLTRPRFSADSRMILSGANRLSGWGWTDTRSSTMSS